MTSALNGEVEGRYAVGVLAREAFVQRQEAKHRSSGSEHDIEILVADDPVRSDQGGSHLRIFEERRIVKKVADSRQAVDEGTQACQTADRVAKVAGLQWIARNRLHLASQREDGMQGQIPQALVLKDACAGGEEERDPEGAGVEMRTDMPRLQSAKGEDRMPPVDVAVASVAGMPANNLCDLSGRLQEGCLRLWG
jgi:hypothetical protein